MRVFITGGTGYIGGHVSAKLRDAGHSVRVLVRSEASASSARERGHEVVSGDLREPSGFQDAVRDSDAVIHVGNTGGPEGGRVDDSATRAMAATLEGSETLFIYTSGVWVLGASRGRTLDESSSRNPIELVEWRGPLEEWLLEKATAGLRAMVLRPGVVFGEGGGIPGMMARGDLPLVGDGSQRWPMVHLDDLAELYVKALEKAPVGSVLHGVSMVLPAREVAESASGPNVKAISIDEAKGSLGPFAEALALDQDVSSRKTREAVGWSPAQMNLTGLGADGEVGA